MSHFWGVFYSNLTEFGVFSTQNWHIFGIFSIENGSLPCLPKRLAFNLPAIAPYNRSLRYEILEKVILWVFLVILTFFLAGDQHGLLATEDQFPYMVRIQSLVFL